jgi:hypothetical protein
MWTAVYVVLVKPGGLRWTENSEGAHQVSTIEDIVDNALEIVPENKTHNILAALLSITSTRPDKAFTI